MMLWSDKHKLCTYWQTNYCVINQDQSIINFRTYNILFCELLIRIKIRLRLSGIYTPLGARTSRSELVRYFSIFSVLMRCGSEISKLFLVRCGAMLRTALNRPVPAPAGSGIPQRVSMTLRLYFGIRNRQNSFLWTIYIFKKVESVLVQFPGNTILKILLRFWNCVGCGRMRGCFILKIIQCDDLFTLVILIYKIGGTYLISP